jgi:hypothetical protein
MPTFFDNLRFRHLQNSTFWIKVVLFSAGARTRRNKLDSLLRSVQTRWRGGTMRRPNVLYKIIWLSSCVAFACGAFCAAAAASGVIAFQESGDSSSDNKQQLIGHWRKTTIVFESPKDEHLVLHADGTAENWLVTADSRSEPVTGRWSVEGKTLTLSFGDNENSRPFTFHEGQLVFPNIPKRRGFWEKIE